MVHSIYSYQTMELHLIIKMFILTGRFWVSGAKELKSPSEFCAILLWHTNRWAPSLCRILNPLELHMMLLPPSTNASQKSLELMELALPPRGRTSPAASSAPTSPFPSIRCCTMLATRITDPTRPLGYPTRINFYHYFTWLFIIIIIIAYPLLYHESLYSLLQARI